MDTQTMLFCNADSNALIESSPFFTITDQEAYNKLALNNELCQIERFVIVAELSWDTKNLNEFYGLDLIKSIRVDAKSTAPILILSHYPYEKLDIDLVQHSTGSMRYFRDPSVSFLPIIEYEQLDKEKVDNYFNEALDEKLYFDLKENLYNPYGYLNEEICAVYDDTYDSVNSTYSTTLIDNFFNKALNTTPVYKEDFFNIKDSLFRKQVLQTVCMQALRPILN